MQCVPGLPSPPLQKAWGRGYLILYLRVVKYTRLYLHRKKPFAYTRGALNSELRVNKIFLAHALCL